MILYTILASLRQAAREHDFLAASGEERPRAATVLRTVLDLPKPKY